ncbi:hypothetical protein UFOVP1219_21 [uncultured Caudovirales phage]|uniref:Uncharacterized protein n=1 Tax=uncultured Caudovirales phage TaxID=2100421 RepID=A0A6J5T6L1_9CAUD|nr:hypothetical protein UFOVP476_67 [uncultured Caudovirales phage]CAB4176079.1 hypothetical protein UFOVP986_8 [uncultured Caudovirales phage]CAB4191044.1 hypothetical protein UFOVP1219_21 [uncultured Caudovirales phage]CAB4223425.1 hypothetical protein UFOVP1671_70 [uncultured Caudovirales phage]CAB5220517.1 hypothetical protein UFOVP358_37 [uncultured Caudovirales phage]
MDIFEALEQGVTILVADHTVKKTNTCKHCQREIVSTEEGWADPLATGDDSVWRLSCDKNDTFTAEHDVEETFCCDTPRPKGFTYFPNVTVCDTCLTQFPYYDCYCELIHDDCNEARAERNMAYREANK